MKRLLITGGTGSFGSTVLREILADDLVEQVIVLSRDELKQDDMRKKIPDQRVRFMIGDVRDRQRMFEAMKGVTNVFCAAALKQVPSCEFHPHEAVMTNVIGTKNTIDAAIQEGVESVVVLSTDKAVYPINAMGISKAMMEKVAVAAASSEIDTKINVTRYGNVMGSRGSVIPFFLNRLKAKDALPITSPLMTRFMMSLGESVDLVMHAMRSENSGSIFVQKAPAANIMTLVRALEMLTGVDAVTKQIGIRHGEKLHEALLSSEEMYVAEETEKYFEVPKDPRDSNYLSSRPSAASSSHDPLPSQFSSDSAVQLTATQLLGCMISAGIKSA